MVLYCAFGRGLVRAVCALCACVRKGAWKHNPGACGGVWGLVSFGGGAVCTPGRLQGALKPTVGHRGHFITKNKPFPEN